MFFWQISTLSFFLKQRNTDLKFFLPWHLNALKFMSVFRSTRYPSRLQLEKKFDSQSNFGIEYAITAGIYPLISLSFS